MYTPQLIGWGWRGLRWPFTASHYFNAGLSLCGRWQWHWEGLFDAPHIPGESRVCRKCLAALVADLDRQKRLIDDARADCLSRPDASRFIVPDSRCAAL